ncbi:MAG TPA: peptidyl-prolyl cis-trans isomerase [Candidatus Binatia bacterium]|nr:peptidyl-prolyl cis-trans isomerase [Candidatus Binatia bacterium]
MTKANPLRTRWRASMLLGVGVTVGILLAAAGALMPTASDFSGNIVARVNGKAITSHEVELVLQRLDRNGAAPAEERREALQRLIDQELLVQRGVAIGLLESDRTVRKALVMAMIDAIVAEVVAEEPTEEELRAFYDSHTAVFTLPARVYVQQIYCGGNGDLAKARTQAEEISAALVHGLSFQEARERYGDAESVPLPNAPVPPQVLRRALGPTLTDAALILKVGEISPPLQSSAGYHILRLVDRQPEQVQPYSVVKQEVRAEYFHRQRDAALQEYLDRSRREALIMLSPHAPQPDDAAQEESNERP